CSLRSRFPGSHKTICASSQAGSRRTPSFRCKVRQSRSSIRTPCARRFDESHCTRYFHAQKRGISELMSGTAGAGSLPLCQTSWAVGKVLDECNSLNDNNLRLSAEYFAKLPRALK